MLNLVKSSTTFNIIRFIRKIQTTFAVWGFCHFTSSSDLNPKSPVFQSSSVKGVPRKNVGIFWDLDNKPPKSFPPYDAAIKLKKATEEFGSVKYMIAYANHHAFRYVPPTVRAQMGERKALNGLENMGIVKPDEPYTCRVCGRRFYNNEKFINHFKQIHEREQMKRVNQIESARGKRRVNLVAKNAMKMEKYRNAARDILTPKVGYGLMDELKRAGVWVGKVSDKPQAADSALRNHMVDIMDRRMVECIVLVSDDSDFVEILKEARLRCLKTVVVGDSNDGALKRTADAAFSWQEIMMGKAKKEAVSVLGRWKDRDILKRLEWSFDPETERDLFHPEVLSEDSDFECFLPGESDASVSKRSNGAWWELESSNEDAEKPPMLQK